MKIFVEYHEKAKPYAWLVTTEGGVLVASFKHKKYANEYRKLINKGGFTVKRKYSPYGRFGLIYAEDGVVIDGYEGVISCKDPNVADSIALMFRKAKGAFILNGPFVMTKPQAN